MNEPIEFLMNRNIQKWSHLGDWRDHQCFHSGTSVVAFLLVKARINHVDNAVDGQGRLRDICGQHDFAGARRSGQENFGLQVGREIGVDRRDDEFHDF